MSKPTEYEVNLIGGTEDDVDLMSTDFPSFE